MLIESSYIKLRRTLITEDNSFAALQEMLIYQNKLSTLYTLNISTPKEKVNSNNNSFLYFNFLYPIVKYP